LRAPQFPNRAVDSRRVTSGRIIFWPDATAPLSLEFGSFRRQSLEHVMIGFCAPAILGRTRALPCNANGKALSLFRDPFLLDRHLNHPALSKMVPVEEMLHSSRINITQGDIAI